MKQHRGFPQSEELVSPFLFKYYLIPWFPITPSLYKSVKTEQSSSPRHWRSAAPSCFFRLLLGGYHQLYFVLKKFVNFVKCHFYLQLALYTWEWLPSGQLVSFQTSHNIHTSLLASSYCTIYRCSPHICAHTQTHTGTHTTAHAGNICNLHLFVCSPHSCWIIS